MRNFVAQNFTNMDIKNILSDLGIAENNNGVMIGSRTMGSGPSVGSYSPTDGKLIGFVTTATKDDYEAAVKAASEAFVEWRKWSAPEEGEVVRRFGEGVEREEGEFGRSCFLRNGKKLSRRSWRGSRND